jgi:LacI family transcriptional regulator
MAKRKRPTVVDVASRAGVGVGTVSRVINHGEAVRQRTRDAVWRAIADLGFRPNSVARSMRTRVTRTIGFIIPDISNPVFSLIAREAEHVLQGENYMLNVANSGDNVEREVRLIRAFAERQCDAIIFVTNSESDTRLLHALRTSGLPVLALDRDIQLKIDRVMIDHARGMQLATDYLLELGHKRIALINVSENVAPGRERSRGFREAHSRRGAKVDEALVRSGRFDQEFGAAQVASLLDLARPPTAVIAAGNQILVGVLQTLQQRSMRFPQDISVIGCDDTPVAQVASPPITIVDRDLAKIGRTAARIILDRLQGKGMPQRTVLVSVPTELKIRGSCAPAR